MAKKATKAKASRKKGKSLTWKGIKLTLPDALPPTVVFDFTEIDYSSGSGNPFPVMRLVRSILGATQFDKLRTAVEKGDIGADDVYDLVTAIMPKYGLTLGESSASASS